MIARRSGIINVALQPGGVPQQCGYCASKHAVDALNQGMRIDLNGKGIRVGAINRGWWKPSSRCALKGYPTCRQSLSGVRPLRPDNRPHLVHRHRPPHVNIADLTVMSTTKRAPVRL